MKLKYDVIIIRGAPGIGKSTIGELLKTDSLIGAVIDIDQIRSMIFRERFIYNENKDYINAIDIVVQLIKKFIVESIRPIVIVDVLSSSLLIYLKTSISSINCLTINLYASKEVLAKRINNRITGYKEVNISMKINEEMQYLSSNIDYLIDTTDMKPKELASIITKYIT